ncbi:MAG: amino acid adenylation domain-containing protein [Alteromonadaceae bacterium]|nr:amino acid adenylation domain-containing protein [Alteromonadaceae bacterium]
MTLTELIEACVAAQIKLSWNDGKLDIKAPKGALTPDVIASLKEHKEALRRWFKSESDAFKKSSEEIVKAPELAAYPLSSNQLRLWFFEQLEPESKAYNIPSQMRLQGALQVELLKKALQETVAKHEILRTIYEVEEAKAQPQQIVLEQFSVPFFDHDISNLQEADQQRTRQLLLSQFFDFKFDLCADICLRAMLLRESEQHFTLAVLVHHIAADAWSVNLITEEILSIYKRLVTGELTSQYKTRLQYKDYAYWQNEQFGSEESEAALSFWRDYLSDSSGYLAIPTDYQRGSNEELCAGIIEYHLDDFLKQKLITFSTKHSVSQFIVLQVVYSIVLALYSNENDISVGFPVANRGNHELEMMVGYFSNTLVIRNQLDFSESFTDLLRRTREQFGQVLSHQHLPFEYLVDQLDIAKVAGAHPLFQHSFVFQEKVTDFSAKQGELNITVEAPGTTSAKFDLMLQIGQVGERIIFRWEYDRSLFHYNTISEMRDNFDFLLEKLLANPENKLRQSVTISGSQQEQMRMFCGAKRNYDQQTLIIDLIDQWANKTPMGLAIHDPIQKINYASLASQSDKLAEQLISNGFSVNDRVGICIDRSCDFIIWIIAILKAGLAYVPIDTTYPPERILNIVKAAKIKGLVVSHSAPKIASITIDDGQVLISEEWLNNLSKVDITAKKPESVAIRRTQLNENNHAYVIFTSGTTGRPKGVVVPHRALINLFRNYEELFNITNSNKMINITSPSFDISVLDWAWALAHGASLYLCDEETRSNPALLSECIESLEITHLNITPSMLGVLDINRDYRFELVTVGGEAPAPGIIESWYKKYPIYNFYGPTESTVGMLYSKIRDSSYIHTSSPFFNVDIFILNAQQQLVPRGCIGELYIGGESLSLGYFDNPKETSNKYVKISHISDTVLYRTGDLAKVDINRNLQIVGRCDGQIKIRGNRVETSEIERVLVQREDIKESVVLKKKTNSGNDILVGFVNPTSFDENIDVRKIIYFLRKKLPAYMVPSNIVMVKNWPVNFNGKVDREKLKGMDVAFIEQDYVAPECDIEIQLVSIWSELLNIPKEEISVLANFYELNGNSIQMMRMLIKINSLFNLEISLKNIIDIDNLRNLSDLIKFAQMAKENRTGSEQVDFKMEGEF